MNLVNALQLSEILNIIKELNEVYAVSTLVELHRWTRACSFHNILYTDKQTQSDLRPLTSCTEHKAGQLSKSPKICSPNLDFRLSITQGR